jgi:CRISPR-associated protein Csm2
MNDQDNVKVLSELKIQEPADARLFAETAQSAADTCNDEKKRKNRPAQIRRFYDELVLWDAKVNFRDKPERAQAFTEARPYIQMIRAKLAYSLGRELISKGFYEIFNSLIRQIDSPETLRNAKLFFEAYLGFAKAFEQMKL